MNVDETGAVWLNYYTDFPLVRLREFQVERVWVEYGVLGNAFAVRGNEVVHVQGKRLATTSLVFSSQPEPTPVSAQEEDGNVLQLGAERYADVAARGSSLVVNTGHAVYAYATSFALRLARSECFSNANSRAGTGTVLRTGKMSTLHPFQGHANGLLWFHLGSC